MDQIVSTKLTPENRAVVPADVRAALGVKAGDQVVYVIHGDHVEMRTPMQMAVALWGANRPDPDKQEDDAVLDVLADRARDEEIDQEVAAMPPTGLSDEEVLASIYSQLGLEG